MVQIVPTSPADIPAINDLVWRSKAHWGYPADLMETWRADLRLRPSQLAGDGAFHGLVEGTLAGMYLLEFRDDEAELLALFVEPTWIGTGVGAALFRHAVAASTERGAEHLLVESDPHATGFYERMGCRVIGERHSVPEGRMLPLLQIDL